MESIFGSDGFRSEFGKDFMTIDFLSEFSNALSDYLIDENVNSPVLIGRDTRSSGKLIQNLLVSILSYRGIDVHCVGVIPSPGLSYLLRTKNEPYSLGIMITASHNDYTDNGIKLFSTIGSKLTEEVEKNIEFRIINDQKNNSVGHPIGQILQLDGCFSEYVKSIFKNAKLLTNSTDILMDCSNGALANLGAIRSISRAFHFVNNRPNGFNINLHCGALEPNVLLEKVRSDNYSFGIAFDGDGDRAIFVSNRYGVIETEKLACLFFLFLNATNNRIVTTRIANLAIEQNIKAMGGELIEVEVGDRFVVDQVDNTNALFGFEPSGHFYFPKESSSMDGLMTAAKFLNLVNFFGEKNIHDRLCAMKHYMRIQRNFSVNKDQEYDFKSIEAKLNLLITEGQEKIIIRKSMWEPVIRIYYDYLENNNFEIIESELEKLLST